MDMRKKEDREIFKKSLGNIDDLIESHYIDHIEQLIEMVNENEKLKEQIAKYQNNALERMSDNAKELGLDY